MNIIEKKNVLFRCIASFLVLVSIGFMIASLILIIIGSSEEKTLSIIALCLVALFALFEIIITMKGWKKESALQKIAFNDNGTINNIPIIAVGIGTAFGLGLMILSIVLFCLRHEEPFVSSSLVIFSIAAFLFVNCIGYFLYLIIFKKREIKLKDFIS